MAAAPETRELTPRDVDEIVAAFSAVGWAKPALLYERYLEERERGRRLVWVAFLDDAFAGCVTVNWESPYPPFREASIPEIQDLNVLPRLRRRGIGSALLERAERGYVPDRRGVTYRYRTLCQGEETRIDDDIALWFTRELWS